MINGSISFGFSAVAAGQKTSNLNADPQLVVASTTGKFSINPAVSSALLLAPGDYIQFADNLPEIEAAIRNKQPELVAIANENGIDLDTEDGVKTIISAFRTIAIFKGVALLNADGTQKMANARTSKEEKEAYAAEHRDEIIAALQEQGVEATDENILAAVGSKQEPAFSGSKVATSSDMTGIGLSLNFSDSNMWNVLKADMDIDSRSTMKRTYNVDTKNPVDVPFNNGKEVVICKALLLKEYTDEVVTRNSK